eukprot:2953450-Prymnesium_polylepis.1
MGGRLDGGIGGGCDGSDEGVRVLGGVDQLAQDLAASAMQVDGLRVRVWAGVWVGAEGEGWS